MDIERWSTIRCELADPDMKPEERILQNLAENLAREGLSTYDQAVAFLELKTTYEMSGARIATHVGKAQSYVNNLIRCIEGVNEDVLARWELECNPEFGLDKDGKRVPNVHAVCTNDFLQKLVARVPKDQQTQELHRALGLIDDGDGDADDGNDADGGGNARQVGTTTRATLANLKKALAAAEEKHKEASGEAAHELRGIKMALKFAIGDNKGIKGVYQTPAPGEK